MHRIILLFLFITIFLHGEEQYILSYRGVVKENRLYTEQFNVSKAMRYKKNENSIPLVTLDYKKEKNIVAFLKTNQDIITQELFKQGILMNDALNKSTYSLDSKTVITMPPTYITVSINEDFVNIRVIK